ncbi:MAG: hypothetical protein CMJ42_21655 [Phyllobacteriaceae bacterium]|nr:hypothetical protein [Phyllobacteriaceae bacterium]MBA93144.1 hypothetical protein [Phyllobacteriaceae bacterium]
MISKDLFLAILSMDAYNRGYGAGLSDGVNVVNGVDIDGFGEASDGTITIGNAKVIANLEDAEIVQEAQAAGFYAVAYEITDGSVDGLDKGSVVISYRGTDAHGDLGIEYPGNLGELLLTDFPLAGRDDYDEPSVHLASAL